VTVADVERFRSILLDERARVVAAIDHLHEEHPGSLEDETGEPGGADNHPADRATDTLDRELDYTLEENSEHVLQEIDEALARIDAGAFGSCRTCGGPISAERLEALPWATQCIECRRRDERG
jgi:RNA polymerase-binding transcription factor